jgi:hypothetical protein
MSYAADGPLEPKYVDEIRDYQLPDVLGYKVIATEWSDRMYTLNVYRVGADGVEEIIENRDTEFENIPDENDVQELIEQVLADREGRFPE